MWHYVLFTIWRNMHSDMEIDRDWRSEELLKLEGGQKILIFRVVYPMRGGQKIFVSRGGLALLGGGNFLGGGSYPSAYYVRIYIIYIICK